MYTAETILKMTNPSDLFSDDETSMKEEYKLLAKQWHPDVHRDNPLASDVMSKINKLYEEGLKLLKEGKWVKDNFIQFKTIENASTAKKDFIAGNATLKINYHTEQAFELGKVYICNKAVFYLVEKQHKEFYDNYIQRVSNFKFANSDMRDEFMKYLPVIEGQFETEEYLGVIVRKTEDVLSLRDVLNHFGGSLPDRHMAWILSTLYNTACYLDYNKLSHNGITIDNYFISPLYHSGVLLGGWWYAVGYGEKLIGVPKDVFDIMTLQTKQSKTGTYVTDLDSIRQIGRALCGDKLGINLMKNNSIPKPVIDWLLGGAMNKSIEEYAAWGSTIDRGYGKRKFVEMKVTAIDLYSKKA